MPADTRPTPGSADSASLRNRNSLISRDLDDIYLMLDHLSGRADKNVSGLTIEMEPASNAAVTGTGAPGKPNAGKRNLIQSVCSIEGWPPNSQTNYSADAATTLFKARDLLNEIAWPASGMTIAYTIMVTDLSKVPRPSKGRAPRDMRDAVAEPALVEASQGAIATTPRDDIAGNEGDAARISLAKSAYPHLLRSARTLRAWIKGYIYMLVVVLLVTAMLSWNVATGKLIIERLNEAKLRETMESARLVSAESAPGTVLQAVSTSSDDVPDAGYVFDTLCTANGAKLPRGDASPPGSSSAPPEATLLRLDSLCGKGVAILDQRFASDDSLRQWFDFWKRITSWGRGLPPEVEAPSDKQPDYRTRIRQAAEMEQQAGDANSVLATYVLPILYGLLGAATAVIRNLNGKMRESTLAPRDLRVSQVQLALGILVGACIGLFLSPTGAPDARLPNVTLAGNGVALSASALSFIAGFGVEAVFKWLEVIISIAFAAGGAAASQHTSPPPRQTTRQP